MQRRYLTSSTYNYLKYVPKYYTNKQFDWFKNMVEIREFGNQ